MTTPTVGHPGRVDIAETLFYATAALSASGTAITDALDKIGAGYPDDAAGELGEALLFIGRVRAKLGEVQSAFPWATTPADTE